MDKSLIADAKNKNKMIQIVFDSPLFDHPMAPSLNTKLLIGQAKRNKISELVLSLKPASVHCPFAYPRSLTLLITIFVDRYYFVFYSYLHIVYYY